MKTTTFTWHCCAFLAISAFISASHSELKKSLLYILVPQASFTPNSNFSLALIAQNLSPNKSFLFSCSLLSNGQNKTVSLATTEFLIQPNLTFSQDEILFIPSVASSPIFLETKIFSLDFSSASKTLEETVSIPLFSTYPKTEIAIEFESWTYNPGETVRFSILVMDENQKPLKQPKSIDISLWASHKNALIKRWDTLTVHPEHPYFLGEFKIPTNSSTRTAIYKIFVTIDNRSPVEQSLFQLNAPESEIKHNEITQQLRSISNFVPPAFYSFESSWIVVEYSHVPDLEPIRIPLNEYIKSSFENDTLLLTDQTTNLKISAGDSTLKPNQSLLCKLQPVPSPSEEADGWNCPESKITEVEFNTNEGAIVPLDFSLLVDQQCLRSHMGRLKSSSISMVIQGSCHNTNTKKRIFFDSHNIQLTKSFYRIEYNEIWQPNLCTTDTDSRHTSNISITVRNKWNSVKDSEPDSLKLEYLFESGERQFLSTFLDSNGKAIVPKNPRLNSEDNLHSIAITYKEVSKVVDKFNGYKFEVCDISSNIPEISLRLLPPNSKQEYVPLLKHDNGIKLLPKISIQESKRRKYKVLNFTVPDAFSYPGRLELFVIPVQDFLLKNSITFPRHDWIRFSRNPKVETQIEEQCSKPSLEFQENPKQNQSFTISMKSHGCSKISKFLGIVSSNSYHSPLGNTFRQLIPFCFQSSTPGKTLDPYFMERMFPCSKLSLIADSHQSLFSPKPKGYSPRLLKDRNKFEPKLMSNFDKIDYTLGTNKWLWNATDDVSEAKVTANFPANSSTTKWKFFGVYLDSKNGFSITNPLEI